MKHHEEHEKKKPLSKSFYTKLYIALGLAIILIVLYNSFQLSSLSPLLEQRVAEAKEAAMPVKIELTVISTPSCDDCHDINATIETLKSIGANITNINEVDFPSEEAQALIVKYGVKKVPTVIISGEINKSSSIISTLSEIGEENNNVYVFTQLIPPFIETSTGKIRGKVSLVHLKKDDCADCFNIAPLIEQLSNSGLKFSKQEEIDIGTVKGKELVAKYSITKVPTIILDKEADVYPAIVQGWNQLGSVEGDGAYVMRQIPLPYYSTDEKRIIGLVTMTVLADKTCADCYEPNDFHKPILQRMGVVFDSERRVDISSSIGKALVSKYSIEKVPTIILEGDMEEYPVLVSAWKDVGSVESDGTYVFRNVEVVQEQYKDLSTNTVVEVSAGN